MAEERVPESIDELNAALEEMSRLSEELLANAQLSPEERQKLEELVQKLKISAVTQQ